MATSKGMKPSTSLLAASALLLAWGCATLSSSAPPSALPSSSPRAWRSTLHREHPLVGRIWDVRQGRWLREAELHTALGEARFVLLGERHDNPDHHLLQAELVEVLTASGRRPALAFEMLDMAQQPAVDEALARAPEDVEALARAVRWERSGWPDWALYRPLFVAGTGRGLPIVAANLPHPQVRELISRGPDALEPALRDRLALDEPLPEDLARDMRQEMHTSHCGHLPENLLEPMVLAQRARDAHMTDRLLETATEDGALLIAGAGHTRTDRGVPAHLARRAPGVTVRSVAFVEVHPESLQPADYAPPDAGGQPPYDYLWFTPAQEREDPCAVLRR
jgi:uncharacterized iron-regulated protein